MTGEDRVRILSMKAKDVLQRGCNYILTARNFDDGWGSQLSKESEAWTTVEVLEMLNDVALPAEVKRRLLTEGTEYLLSSAVKMENQSGLMNRPFVKSLCERAPV